MQNKLINDSTRFLFDRYLSGLRHSILLEIAFFAANNNMSLAGSAEIDSAKHSVIVDERENVKTGKQRHISNVALRSCSLRELY